MSESKRLETVLHEVEARMKMVGPECVLHIRAESPYDGSWRAFHVGPGWKKQYIGSTLEEALRNMAADKETKP